MIDWLEIAGLFEKATGPDRELDARLWLAFGIVKMRWSERQQAWAFFNEPFGPGRLACLSAVKGSEAEAITEVSMYDFGPRYTASLDAITTLIEREMPKSDWQLCKGGDCTLIYGGGVYEPQSVDARAATPALSLCAALCRAMHAASAERARPAE